MAENFSSLVDMQVKARQRYAKNLLFGTKKNGAYQWMTHEEFGQEVDKFRAALALLGVKRGDKVAVIADNRVEWAVAAYATYGLAAHYVPMYESQLPKDWKYIVEDSGAKVLLVAKEAIYEKTKSFPQEINGLEHIISFEAPESAAYSYAGHLKKGAASPVPPTYPTEEETAGLIYTSGTTGKPKGVILSHGNIISNVNAVHGFFPMDQNDRSLSFLPWAHSFGQTVELHVLLSCGASMGIAESVSTLMDNFGEVKPTLLFAVPRIFNRIYDGLNKKMAAGSAVARFLFNKGLKVAQKRRELAEKGKKSAFLDAQYKFFDKLVFSKVKARFGGRLKYAFSGGAALSREVAMFIDDVGILVFEGYGLTETSPIASANSPHARKIGTIGKPIPGVQIYICNDEGKKLPQGQEGEIVVVGPNIMQGYHNHPEDTAKVIFDMDGKRAFRTGDMGSIDPEGFIKITGRVKEQYKLENGKYVVPSPLEELLKLSGYIDQVFLYGFNKLYNVVLVYPDEAAIKSWAKQNGVSGETLAEINKDPRTHALIGEELKKHSAEFKGYERPKKWALLDEGFTIENDMMTPKMSIKRNNVMKRYQDLLDSLYQGDVPGGGGD